MKRRPIRSPGLIDESSVCVTSSTASFTITSMCPPSSLPIHKASCSSGYFEVTASSTERTVESAVTGTSIERWPEPSPPRCFVIHEKASTVAEAVLGQIGLEATSDASTDYEEGEQQELDFSIPRPLLSDTCCVSVAQAAPPSRS